MQTALRSAFSLLVMNTVLMGWHSAFGAQARKAPAPSQIGPVVLEMIEKDARPSAPGDEYLYFRLYQDGTAEFEIKYSDGPLPHGLKVHRIRLKDEELDDLSGLWGGCLDLPGDFDPMQRLDFLSGGDHAYLKCGPRHRRPMSVIDKLC